MASLGGKGLASVPPEDAPKLSTERCTTSPTSQKTGSSPTPPLTSHPPFWPTRGCRPPSSLPWNQEPAYQHWCSPAPPSTAKSKWPCKMWPLSCKSQGSFQYTATYKYLPVHYLELSHTTVYRAVAGDVTTVKHCNTFRTLNVIFRALSTSVWQKNGRLYSDI